MDLPLWRGCGSHGKTFSQTLSSQKQFLTDFNSYKACCDDERCESVESSARFVLPCRWRDKFKMGQCGNLGKTGHRRGGRLDSTALIHVTQQFFRSLDSASPQLFFDATWDVIGSEIRAAILTSYCIGTNTVTGSAQKKSKRGCYGQIEEIATLAGSYCSASINRVIVRFRSLSERRRSSILLIECNTVV